MTVHHCADNIRRMVFNSSLGPLSNRRSNVECLTEYGMIGKHARTIPRTARNTPQEHVSISVCCDLKYLPWKTFCCENLLLLHGSDAQLTLACERAGTRSHRRRRQARSARPPLADASRTLRASPPSARAARREARRPHARMTRSRTDYWCRACRAQRRRCRTAIPAADRRARTGGMPTMLAPVATQMWLHGSPDASFFVSLSFSNSFLEIPKCSWM